MPPQWNQLKKINKQTKKASLQTPREQKLKQNKKRKRKMVRVVICAPSEKVW